MSQENPKDVLGKRREKMTELKNQGIALFPNDFRATHSVADISAKVADAPETLTEDGPFFCRRGAHRCGEPVWKGGFPSIPGPHRAASGLCPEKQGGR